MIIRRANIDEFKNLWNYSETNTYNYFLEGLVKENIEFWTIDTGTSKLIGELYIFWNSEDKDEADGVKRAYLCALRIDPKHQGMGLSSKLMKTVTERILEKGFTEITIGIDNDNYDKLLSMYKGWGFNNLVKQQECDYHYIDKDNKPVKYEEPINIYMKSITND